MDILGLNELQKIQATNAIKQAFPGVIVKQKRSLGSTHIIYEGVGHKSYLKSTNLASSHDDLDEGAEIENIKSLIIATRAELNSVQSKIDERLSTENIEREVMKGLLCSQANLHARIEELNDILIELFRKEATRLSAQQAHCDALHSEEAKQLNEEVEKFIQYLNKDVETRNDFSTVMPELTSSVEENCPLLYSILRTILMQKDASSVSKMRIKSAVHAIAILVSLRSQKIKNNFKVMFTFLCICFGAGCRFIGMLNHVGLTVSWQKAMQVFDDRAKMQKDDLAKITPGDIPLILLIDNINIYRGKRKHLRVVRPEGSTMWNFTAQAMLIPELDGVRDLFLDEQSCLAPQGVVTEMQADELFVESHPEKSQIFETSIDRYLIGLLDDALNKVPFTLSHLKSMSEEELNKCLTAEGFKNLPEPEYDINIPSVEDTLKNAVPPVKSNVHILPLSLQDNSTILGTMSILDDLSNTFNLPSQRNNEEYVPFDSTTGVFDVICARTHFELLLSKKAYDANSKESVEQMRSREKAVEGSLEFEEVEEESDDEDVGLHAPGSTNTNESTTLEKERRRFESEDKLFWEAYDYLVQEHITAIRSDSEEAYMLSIQSAENKAKAWRRDHLNRTMLPVAVERNDKTMVQYLLDIGLNVNDREGCGLTALNLAVLQKNNSLVNFLVKSGAQHSGPLFTSVPLPLLMAKTMNLTEIVHVFEEDGDLSDEENFLIRCIDSTFGEREGSDMQVSDNSYAKCNRTQLGFVTPLVGDVGTCKTNNATMSRSAAYRWVGICPGDLHNKGYFCEAVFKVHGPSGFPFTRFIGVNDEKNVHRADH